MTYGWYLSIGFEDMCGDDIRKIPTPSSEKVAYI